MKLLMLLLSCVTASAALPPLPVVRPAPLQSPKASSTLKSKPMARTFSPASVPASTVFCTFTRDMNFFGCEPTDPGCVLYDVTNVRAVQMAGYSLTIEFRDGASGGWTWMASFGAGPDERMVEATMFQPKYIRPEMRLFRSVQGLVVPTGFTPASATQVNTTLKGWVTTTSSKR